MSAQTITVYIDPTQQEAQQNNNYSLYLAKKVNDTFTVIWQSLGPLPTSTQPGYNHKNTFQISVPSYQVNYGTVTETQGSVTFQGNGEAIAIDLGQSVDLSAGGEFKNIQNDGHPGTITVHNARQGNPHEILYDQSGNPIFVNIESGMDVGKATLTPIDTYQVWFGSYQETGTIIADNVSNTGIITFEGTDNATISYNKDGEWVPGKLPSNAVQVGENLEGKLANVVVAAIFTTALTTASTTYVLNKLINKFGVLKPTKIRAKVGDKSITLEFEKKLTNGSEIVLDRYEHAVQHALAKAAGDPSSDIPKSWSFSETTLQVSF
ncbi:hypothetical protein MJ904_17260 [Massilia sp. MB5]|uniref:hypothetical protein n=1 Tax=Massilia sp. MB5 TaxID=2919578 RepID=UPI001F0E69D1|nr:hypothetical protein [Massilia sp. MB5]UMR28855.1 hypothetical protein MJ904_17260 [Massilia sp. MB5]